VVKKLLKLLRFRNENPAFEGECRVGASGSKLNIQRTSGEYSAELEVDFKTCSCSIRYHGPDGISHSLEL